MSPARFQPMSPTTPLLILGSSGHEMGLGWRSRPKLRRRSREQSTSRGWISKILSDCLPQQLSIRAGRRIRAHWCFDPLRAEIRSDSSSGLAHSKAVRVPRSRIPRRQTIKSLVGLRMDNASHLSKSIREASASSWSRRMGRVRRRSCLRRAIRSPSSNGRQMEIDWSTCKRPRGTKTFG